MSGLVEHMRRRAELMESLADPEQPKATLAWQVEAQATLAKGARDNELAAVELTRLQAENEDLRADADAHVSRLEKVRRQEDMIRDLQAENAAIQEQMEKARENALEEAAKVAENSCTGREIDDMDIGWDAACMVVAERIRRAAGRTEQ